MGTKERREREKEDMRNAILEAAAKIIVAEGYDKLSMRKIADAIDYSPTTIYLYYKDKAQIIEDISMMIYKEIVANIKNSLTDNESLSVDNQLRLSFKAFINTLVRKPEMGKAVIISGARAIIGPEENDVPPEENGIAILRDLLLKGRQQNILRELDENVSWMMITALIGYSMFAIEAQLFKKENWHRLVDVYAEMLISGLLNCKGI